MTARFSLSSVRRELFVALLIGVFALLLSLDRPSGLTEEGWRAFCLFVLVTSLWVTNLIPLAVTSLLAIAGIPLLGIMSEAEAYAYFGSKVVFFIMGAFILGAALVSSGLSSRLAIMALDRFGRTPRRLLFSVFIVGAVGSCCMSEHAVAAMLFPIAMSVSRSLDLKERSPAFGQALFFALAWGCIIGGSMTILGGGRGPLAIGILEETTGGTQTIGFVQYIVLDIPLVILLLVAGWIVLTRSKGLTEIDVDSARARLRASLRERGPVTAREKGVGLTMLVTIAVWTLRGEQWGLANIAICSTAILFLLRMMTWRDVEEGVNWGILLMYGGAICLGAALHDAGTTQWITGFLWQADFLSSKVILLLFGLTTLILTELMSNSAVIAIILPTALELGASRGIDLRIVTMSIVLPSNFAFILPMATPATALAYSSGFLNLRSMLVRGILMNSFGLMTLVVLLWVYWPLLGYQI